MYRLINNISIYTYDEVDAIVTAEAERAEQAELDLNSALLSEIERASRAEQDIMDYLTAQDISFNNTTINGTLTVNGNIIQEGESYETHAEKLYTKKDLIYTRDGAISGLSPESPYTGIQAIKYDGTNDGQLVFDKNGVARVGDVGDTQPLATREEEPLDNGVAIWDSTTKKFNTKIEDDLYVGKAKDSDKLGGELPEHYSKATNLVNGTGTDSLKQTSANVSSGEGSFAEGKATVSSNIATHTEGYGTEATDKYAHAEGQITKATSEKAHSEGMSTLAGSDNTVPNHLKWNCQHAEGYTSKSIGDVTHAEGWGTVATDTAGHAEGQLTFAVGPRTHAEGRGNKLSIPEYAKISDTTFTSSLDISIGSVLLNEISEDYNTKSVIKSKTQDGNTYTYTVSGKLEGTTSLIYGVASGENSHVEGNNSIATGKNSHAQNEGTIASANNQTVIGKYNIVHPESDNIAFVIGKGTSDTNRHDAFSISWDGAIKINDEATTLSTASNLVNYDIKGVKLSNDTFFISRDGRVQAEDIVTSGLKLYGQRGSAGYTIDYDIIKPIGTPTGLDSFVVSEAPLSGSPNRYIRTKTIDQVKEVLGIDGVSTATNLENGTGTNSIQQTRGCDASGDDSAALGWHTKASGASQLAIGQNNSEFTGPLVVGGGASPSTPKNIFTVDWNGNVKCNGVDHLTSQDIDNTALTLNDCIKSGVYTCSRDEHRPLGTNILCVLVIERADGYVTQIGQDIDTTQGLYFRCKNNFTWTGWQKVVTDESIPAGTIIQTLSDTTPTGWLECNGQSLDKNSYSRLYQVIGIKYGGSGNNFNLPNLKNKYLIGTIGTGDRGNWVDESLPQHSHGFTDDGHTHGYTDTYTGWYRDHSLRHNVNTGPDSWQYNNQEKSRTTNNSKTNITINGVNNIYNASGSKVSNSIYTNGGAVRPASIKVRFLIKF